MTATKSKARSKTTGKKQAAKKSSASRKKTTGKKAGKKSTKKTARKTTGKSSAKKSSGRKASAKKDQPKAPRVTRNDEPADLLTLTESSDLVDMMQVPVTPAPDSALDRIFTKEQAAAKPGKDSSKAEFAAWSVDPDQNGKPVALAMQGHVLKPFQAIGEFIAKLPLPVPLSVAFLAGLGTGWLLGWSL